VGITAKRYVMTQQVSFLKSDIESVLNDLKGSPRWAWILHDKDVDDKGVLKAPHVHIWIEYDKQKNLPALAKELDRLPIEVNAIEYARSKVGCLAYLTHENASSKHQYDKSEIHSNFDFETELRNEKIHVSEVLQDIYNKIESKEINEWNLEQKLDMATCVKYDREIKRAFDYMRKRYGMGADKNMTVIYIWGDSGTGKTTLAKYLAQENKMSCFVSSASNDILDGYRGEECIILDDLRACNMKLEEFLKLADNHTSSTVRSRYFNKSIATCRMLIITCCLPLGAFWKSFENTQFEQSKQFFRRISVVLHVVQSEKKNEIGIETLQLRVVGGDSDKVDSKFYNFKIPLPNVPKDSCEFLSKFEVNPFDEQKKDSDEIPF